MRKMYWIMLGFIIGDLAVAWLLMQFGVFSTKVRPPEWVLDAFLTPFVVAGGMGFVLTLCDIRSGWTYSVFGGARTYFSEEPFDYLYNIAFKIVTFGLTCIGFMSIMFGYGS